MSRPFRFSTINALLITGFACSVIAVVTIKIQCVRKTNEIAVLHRHYFGQRAKIDIALKFHRDDRSTTTSSDQLGEYLRHQALWTLVECSLLSDRWDKLIMNEDQARLARDSLQYLGNPEIPDLRKRMIAEFDSGDEEQNAELYPEIYDNTSEAYIVFEKYLQRIQELAKAVHDNGTSTPESD